MLAPNKQNLLLTKKRQKSVNLGLKLLKEKRTGLIKSFLDVAREGKQKQSEISSEIEDFFLKYNSKISIIDLNTLIDNLIRQPNSYMQVNKKKISGVQVENLIIQLKKSINYQLKDDIINIINKFTEYFPQIIIISQLKKTCQIISKEIERVNRQIANLETQTLQLSEDIKQIQSVLNERDNLEKATLIQLFK
jgi:V/A-type H+-transporting ATPase subunit D